MTMPVQIAAFYVALLILGLIILQIRVILLRRGRRIGIGDGGDHQLAKAIRVHANYAENVPFGLVGLVLMALLGVSTLVIHLIGVLLVVARIAHAYGLSQTSKGSMGRVGGMVGSNIALIIMAIVLLLKAI
jgi:uncharacterized protein